MVGWLALCVRVATLRRSPSSRVLQSPPSSDSATQSIPIERRVARLVASSSSASSVSSLKRESERARTMPARRCCCAKESHRRRNA